MIRAVGVLGLAALVAAPCALASRAASPSAAAPGLLSVRPATRRSSSSSEGLRHRGAARSSRAGCGSGASRAASSPRSSIAGACRSSERDRRTAHLDVEPLQSTEYWRPLIGADSAVPPGPGKPITVLDTGIDLSHPEFAGRPNTTILGPQSLADSGDDFHGTAVSSVAAAPENGVGAPRRLPAGGAAVGRRPAASDVATSSAGSRAAIEAGPSVINMSFGVPTSQLLVGHGRRRVPDRVDRRRGGRKRTPAGHTDRRPCELQPRAHDRRHRSAEPDRELLDRRLQVDLAAPGVDIPAAIPVAFNPSGYASVDGTSFAAPIVTGATAWVWTARPQLDNTQIFDLMRYSAIDLGPHGFDRDTGFGAAEHPRRARSRRQPRATARSRTTTSAR